jgi:hypothetical protein
MFRDDARQLTVQDRREVEAFARFLEVAPDRGPVPVGWIPYCLGEGPPPPPCFDHVPVTAWTVPG